MYLLTDTTPEAVATLTATLDGLGDSLLVVGGPDLWNVHVHVDDPGAAVEAGVAAGRPERIRITHFATQVDSPRAAGAAGRRRLRRRPGHRRAAARGRRRRRRLRPGPARLGRAAAPGGGVDRVDRRRAAARRPRHVHGRRDRRPGGRRRRHRRARRARPHHRAGAGRARGARPRPLGARQRRLDDGAAAATRHGAVSVATKEALTWAGVCHPGDVLGIVDGDVAFLGTDVAAAAREVLDRLLSAGGELVTLVVGAEAETGLGAGVAAALERDRPELEVVVIDGGQPVYPLLVGVE